MTSSQREHEAPHEPLTSYYPDESRRRAWLRGIFDRTAPDYDAIERAMAFGSGPWYRNRALRSAGLVKGMRVLDVGMGTGLVTREAVAITGDAIAVYGSVSPDHADMRLSIDGRESILPGGAGRSSAFHPKVNLMRPAIQIPDPFSSAGLAGK